MSCYTLKHKLKSSQITMDWEIQDIEVIKKALSQLQNWPASFNWQLIISFDSLEILQVIERQSDKYENWIYYDEFTYSDGTTWYINSSDIEPDYNCQLCDKDITNDLLIELWIRTSQEKSINSNWEVTDDYMLFIKWERFPLKQNTKYCELFRIIYRCKVFYSKNILTYDDLLENFKVWAYKEINEKDLCYTRIRDTLKNKLLEINTSFWVELIKLCKDKIILWEE
jgi:hypothetical protein